MKENLSHVPINTSKRILKIVHCDIYTDMQYADMYYKYVSRFIEQLTRKKRVTRKISGCVSYTLPCK